MKALTLWQPWASFMMALPSPPKTIETRGWWTDYRGPLAIHAAKKEPADIRAWFSFGPERSLLMRYFADLARLDRFSPEPSVAEVFAALPRGCILGSVHLFDVQPTVMFDQGFDRRIPIPDDERRLGDYMHGRFGWRTRNPVRLTEPIPWRGAQGLWTLPDGLVPIAPGAAGVR